MNKIETTLKSTVKEKEIKGWIADVQTRSAQDQKTLEKRLDILEQKKSVQEAPKEHKSKVKELDAKIKEMEKSHKNDTKLKELKKDIQKDVDAKIALLKEASSKAPISSVEALKSQVTELQTTVDALSTALSNVRNKVNLLEATGPPVQTQEQDLTKHATTQNCPQRLPVPSQGTASRSGVSKGNNKRKRESQGESDDQCNVQSSAMTESTGYDHMVGNFPVRSSSPAYSIPTSNSSISTSNTMQKIPAQGYPNQGYPNQGFPNQGFPNQGFPNQGYPNQGFPNQGFPNQVFPNQAFPNQGFQQVIGGFSMSVQQQDQAIQNTQHAANVGKEANTATSQKQPQGQCNSLSSSGNVVTENSVVQGQQFSPESEAIRDRLLDGEITEPQYERILTLRSKDKARMNK